MRIGVHNSANGGILNVIKEVSFLKTNATQFFVHSPRSWDIKEIEENEKKSFRDHAKKIGIFPVVVHCSYLINPLSKNTKTVKKSKKLLKLEIQNSSGISEYYVLHIKENRDESIDKNIKKLIKFFNEIKLDDSVKILFENSASGMLSDIRNLFRFYSALKDYAPVYGICLDTAHVYEAGYDIKTQKGVEKIFDDLKDISRLKLIHLNDSKTKLSSHIDRHFHIGKGEIGINGFKNFFKFKEFKEIPLILETPKKNLYDDLKNLKLVKNIIGG